MRTDVRTGRSGATWLREGGNKRLGVAWWSWIRLRIAIERGDEYSFGKTMFGLTQI